MGRPPLDKNSETKVTLVRLTKAQADRIDALAGKKRRAQFIRAAIERELDRRTRAAKAKRES